VTRERARTAAGRRQPSVYRARRRALLGAVIAVVCAAAAFAVVDHLVNDQPTMPKRASQTRKARPAATPTTSTEVSTPAPTSTYLPAVRWPQRGQAALVIGNGEPAASPDEQPVPIASVAKVMTAYLTLEDYPLNGAQDGFTVTVTAADAQAEAQDAALDQSVAPVQAGEQLTERQMLEGLLIPSGNNMAQMLAVQVAGSETAFVAEMNTEAHALGMNHTVCTDPSGWDQGTVSTAADQLRVFQQAMRFPVFDQVISMPSVTLPFAGTLTNTNPLIAEGYAGKTGSDSAAGACLAFFTHVTVDGRQETAVGVVLGQWEDNSTSVVLAAAGEAAEQLVDSVADAIPTTVTPGVAGDPGQNGASHASLPQAPIRRRRSG
jgi:serine-type D-Ala-D-Ala carboxypeptidase (penicillin-binding protein 5/6)